MLYMLNWLPKYPPKRPENPVLSALCTLVPPRLVLEHLNSTPVSLLIQHLAAKLGSNPHQLLASVGALLRLNVAWKLKAPTEKLVQKTGFSGEELRARSMLPQESFLSPAGYALVLGDPAAANRDDWEVAGVEVLLGLGGDIEKCWEEYFRKRKVQKELSISEIVAETVSLCEKAHAQGASEIFLGHPDDSRYEFIAAGRSYGGKLYPRAYELLALQLKATRSVSYEANSPTLSRITFTLTTNAEKPVVFVSWSARKEKSSNRR